MAETTVALTLAECGDIGGALPPGAAALLASLPPPPAAAPDDALFALVVVLMAESGFQFFAPDADPASGPTQQPQSCDEGVAVTAGGDSAGFNARRVASLRWLPSGWRQPASGLAGTDESGMGGAGPPPPQRAVAVHLGACPRHRVRLVAVAVGGALVANMLLEPGLDAGSRALCLSLRSARYIDLRGGKWQTRRLAELSRRVKDALATPARCAILRAEGLRYPALDGMPGEVVLRIARLLPAPALLSLGVASKALLAVSRDPALWRALLRRDFGVVSLAGAEATGTGTGTVDGGEAGTDADPLSAYRRHYERERLWWRDREARQRWLRNMRLSDAHRDLAHSSDSDSSLPPPAPPPPVWYLRADDGLPRRTPFHYGPAVTYRSPALVIASAQSWRPRPPQRIQRRPFFSRALLQRGSFAPATTHVSEDDDEEEEENDDGQFGDATSEEAPLTSMQPMELHCRRP